MVPVTGKGNVRTGRLEEGKCFGFEHFNCLWHILMGFSCG